MKKDRNKMKYRHVKGFGRKTIMQMIKTGQDPGMKMTEKKINQACRGQDTNKEKGNLKRISRVEQGER